MVEAEFRKHLFVMAVKEVAERWDRLTLFSAAQKVASFEAGITVFAKDIKILNKPWREGRFGWTVMLVHPEFGEMRISSDNFLTIEA